YKVSARYNKGNSSGVGNMWVALSESNTTTTNSDYINHFESYQAAGGNANVEHNTINSQPVTEILTAKKTFYLIGRTGVSGMTDINFKGDYHPTIVQFLSAYF